jgi:ParB-like chromosome segregation protein Spo0J
MREWGWTSPVLADEEGGLIARHARLLAARQLGIAEIPVMVARGWTEAQKRAYLIADNQLSITGSGWDPELLRLELGELKLEGFDLALTGFGELELGEILADRTEGLTDPDEAPAAPEHTLWRERRRAGQERRTRGFRIVDSGWSLERRTILWIPSLSRELRAIYSDARDTDSIFGRATFSCSPGTGSELGWNRRKQPK